MPEAKTKPVVKRKRTAKKTTVNTEPVAPSVESVEIETPPVTTELVHQNQSVAKQPQSEPITKQPDNLPYILLQPERNEKGRYSKEDAKTLRTSLLWRHPDNGGGYPVITMLKPGKKQRPYNFLDKISWLGAGQLFATRRPIYLMKEIQFGDSFLIAAYEPDALIPNDMTPHQRYDNCDWSMWRALILHKTTGWKDIIKTGIIAACIIGVVIFFWLSWANVRKGPPAQAAPPISTPGVK